MYIRRISYSAIIALIMLFIHQYIQGIPDCLQQLTNIVSQMLMQYAFYTTSFNLYLQLILLVLIPIGISTIIGMLYKIIYKSNFTHKITTAWLIWLCIAIPHIIY